MLAILFLWLASNLDTMWMWLITVASLAALVGLIIAMRFRDMYTGPKILGDDIREFSHRVMRDDGGEADRVEYLRELDEREQRRLRMIEDADDHQKEDPETSGRMTNPRKNEDGKDR